VKKIFILLFFIFFPASIFAKTLKVPSEYPTIQEAVDAASDGDTVFIEAGDYFDVNVTVNKPLHFEGAGETTIIHPNLSGLLQYCFYISQNVGLIRISKIKFQSENMQGHAIIEESALKHDDNKVVVRGCIFDNYALAIKLNSDNKIEKNKFTNNNLSYTNGDSNVVFTENEVIGSGEASDGVFFSINSKDKLIDVKCNTFRNNRIGVILQAWSFINSDHFTMYFNNIMDNSLYGFSSDGGPYDITYNYWGSATGPRHAGNLGGEGDHISGNVFYDPWLTEPFNFQDEFDSWYNQLNHELFYTASGGEKVITTQEQWDAYLPEFFTEAGFNFEDASGADGILTFAEAEAYKKSMRRSSRRWFKENLLLVMGVTD
jgi:hypothetical protein